MLRRAWVPIITSIVPSFNEEIVSFRGVTAGENIVTVHVYSKNDEKPTTGTIKLIRVKPFEEVVVKKREFKVTGEEKIAFRFKTDKDGNILDINELSANLRQPFGQWITNNG